MRWQIDNLAYFARINKKLLALIAETISIPFYFCCEPRCNLDIAFAVFFFEFLVIDVVKILSAKSNMCELFSH